jgi:hypothetical protein
MLSTMRRRTSSKGSIWKPQSQVQEASREYCCPHRQVLCERNRRHHQWRAVACVDVRNYCHATMGKDRSRQQEGDERPAQLSGICSNWSQAGTCHCQRLAPTSSNLQSSLDHRAPAQENLRCRLITRSIERNRGNALADCDWINGLFDGDESFVAELGHERSYFPSCLNCCSSHYRASLFTAFGDEPSAPAMTCYSNRAAARRRSTSLSGCRCWLPLCPQALGTRRALAHRSDLARPEGRSRQRRFVLVRCPTRYAGASSLLAALSGEKEAALFLRRRSG